MAGWVVSLLIPSIGLVITWIMWTAPLRAILEVKRTSNLGTLNPLPFPITIINCIGWVIYGCMIRNYFVFFGNIPGLILSTYYMLVAFPLVDKYDRERIEALVLFGIGFWGCMGFIAGTFFGASDAQRTAACQFIGYLATFFALAYYAGGLTKFVEVIRTRDSSSLHIPSSVTNLTNATLWTVYGYFAVNDVNLYAPNGVGIILSAIQLTFCFIFPRKASNPQQLKIATDETAISTLNPIQQC